MGKNLKRAISTLIAISWFSLSVQAALPPDESWVAIYNGPANKADNLSGIVTDMQGNVYVTGKSYGNDTYDYATIKYDSNGNQKWIKRYNGPSNRDDEAKAIATDDSGNIYVTGGSGRTGAFDYATIKYDTNGNQKWVARYIGSTLLASVACAIDVDNSGNVYVTGTSPGANPASSDYATIKYDPNGNQLWAARYSGPTNSENVARVIAVDNAGNVYVTGYSRASETYYDYATVKYDPNGNQLWVARYHNTFEDRATEMAVDNAGNVYVTGYSSGSGTNSDYATIKYDPNGNQLWVARYHNTFEDRATEMAVDNAGNVYVTGYSMGSDMNHDYATIKYDTNGNQKWVARYNGPGSIRDEAYAMVIDNFGNIYVTGLSFYSSNEANVATVKYNSSGNQQWAVQYNKLGKPAGLTNYIALDNKGNVYVTGFRPGVSTNSDYITIKYTQKNQIPTANAGSDQTVYAYIDGIADVNLDGSDSNDSDGDELIYKWTWTVDSNAYEANSVNPIIELPVGVHTIELVVNDGFEDSLPDYVDVNVITPVKAGLEILPQTINIRSHGRWIWVYMVLPKGCNAKDVDKSQPLVMEPLGVESKMMNVFTGFRRYVWITAAFDRDEVCDNIKTGRQQISVVGQFKSGQYFYGSDTIKVIGKKK